MEIKWYGGSIATLELKNLSVYFDYPLKELPEPNKTKQIAIYTMPASLSNPEKHRDRIIIDTPGEYEIAGVEIRLIPVNDHQLVVLKVGENTFANFNLVSIPQDKVLKTINGIDILLLSVGKSSLDSQAASDICNKIEPKVLIPFGFQDLKEVETFLKNENFDLENILENYKFVRAELDQEERKNILLKTQKL